MALTHLTILNSMAGSDFAQALDHHVAWGLKYVDLKDAVFGKSIAALTDAEAQTAAQMIAERGLTVYCLSSTLLSGDIEMGEAAFRQQEIQPLDRLLSVAHILQPHFIRLLAARSSRRAEFADCADYLSQHHPWVWDCYREAAGRLYDAGFHPTIENEAHQCLFSNPNEIVHFFEVLDRHGQVSLIWDVQNLWQMGTFPSLEVYQQLKPLLGYYHVKGGCTKDGGTALAYRSSLADASWPVVEITAQVIADGISPVICLNPPHGAPPPDWNGEDDTMRDITFLREHIPEIA